MTDPESLAVLQRQLDDLERAMLPCLTRDSLKIGGSLRSELPQTDSTYRLLDHYLTEVFANKFRPPLEFQWAGGPDDGRIRQSLPDEDGFDSEEAFEAAEHQYWRRFGEPEPWQLYPSDTGTPAEALDQIRTFLLKRVRWSLNNKEYPVQDRIGSIIIMQYSQDLEDQRKIDALEQKHEAARRALIDQFLEGVAEPFQFFHTQQLLTADSARSRCWSMQLDAAYVLLDAHHLRLFWTLHDRHHG